MLDLDDVTVVGNSIGGWVVQELALLGSPRVGRVVLVDSVGVEVAGHPVADFFALTFPELAQLSYHAPARFVIDPASMTDAARAVLAANRAALGVYAGAGMSDPTLLARLRGVEVPTLVVWGENDRIADHEYGRALAAAIPGARFELLSRTGHLPQRETPSSSPTPSRRSRPRRLPCADGTLGACRARSGCSGRPQSRAEPEGCPDVA